MNKHLSSPVQSINFYKNKAQIVLIEASAGTGKTWTLERLFVKALIQQPLLSLEQILLVTFTNNAVNELKERIFGYLKFTLEQLILVKNSNLDVYDDAIINYVIFNKLYDQAINVITQTIQNFDNASIYTIHGFCNKILQNYQLNCNISFPIIIADNKRKLLLNIIQNYLREKIINNPMFKSHMEIVYLNLLRILEIDQSQDIAKTLLERLPLTKRFFKFYNNKFIVNYNVLETPNLEYLLSEKLDKHLILYNLLSSLIQYINIYYDDYIKISNTIDYDAMISIVANQLATNKTFAQQILKDYPIAFIDEFQDTDALQWDIFKSIYNNNGHLIIVGDPKQSIYKFRGADVNTYNLVKGVIDHVMILDVNYRSHKNIVNFINKIFTVTNNQKFFGEFIEFKEVTHGLDSNHFIKLPTKHELNLLLKNLNVNELNVYSAEVHIIAIKGNKSLDKKNSLLDAMILEILLLLNFNESLIDKIAILVTKNQEALEVVDALNKYNIKANLFNRVNVFTTSTAADLLIILKSIFDITNFHLLKNALATNLFNIPLVVLLNLEQTTYFVPKKGNIQERFAFYKEQLLTQGIISFIYSLIDDLNIIHNVNTTKLTRQEISNLIQLGELLHKYVKSSINPIELIHILEQKIIMYQDNFLESEGTEEELIRLDSDNKYIQVITQHKAKGLEFDIVFCPFFIKHASIEQIIKGQNLEFVKYYNNHQECYELTTDISKIKASHEELQLEAHRLNYVALTRAKSRLYIFLNEIRKTKTGYFANSKPEKIHELFGFVPNDNKNNNHYLFDYFNIFEDTAKAIKQEKILDGVVIYQREQIDNNLLNKLKYFKHEVNKNIILNKVLNNYWTNDIQTTPTFMRQSYSSITNINYDDYLSFDNLLNSSNINTREIISPKVIFNYDILNQHAGPKFGILIHTLCEQYPLSKEEILKILISYNIDDKYLTEIEAIINKIMTYEILPSVSIKTLKNKIHEFEFNLTIKKSINIQTSLKTLFTKHYGKMHPYTISCSQLKTIEQGFLHGFIDLCFEHKGKYFILDYKTNYLDDYNSTNNVDNPLLIANAHSHYYLQYILYLVALKRYLEIIYKINDATSLLGGAIYYYVRGLFIKDKICSGIFIDDTCQQLVKEVDMLFN